MKASKPHRVPLAPRAVELLREAAEYADGSGYVFPSPRGKALSDNTLSKLLRELQIACVPHGFRSSFRDWCGDTGQSRELAEMALAHVVKGVEGAYARSDLFALRADLMQAWGRLFGPIAVSAIFYITCNRRPKLPKCAALCCNRSNGESIDVDSIGVD